MQPGLWIWLDGWRRPWNGNDSNGSLSRRKPINGPECAPCSPYPSCLFVVRFQWSTRGPYSSERYTSAAYRTVIYPPQRSSLTSNLIIHHPPISCTPLSQHAHFPLSAVFVGFCFCVWEPLFYWTSILRYPVEDHPLRMGSPLSPSPVSFYSVLRASHAEMVCFRLLVEHIWVETVERTGRLMDVLAIFAG